LLVLCAYCASKTDSSLFPARGSPCSATERSVLPCCNAASLCKWLPAFRTDAVLLSSRAQFPRRGNLETLKVKATCVLEGSENALRRNNLSHETEITG